MCRLHGAGAAEETGRRLGFFPGSTIGNLTPQEAIAFLCNARSLLGDDGALVLGADLKKDPQRLHDAYNDSAGVTAAFTLNLLRRMNRELHATFDLAAFAHEAFYNAAKGRIEIYFSSLRPQTVSVAGRSFALRRASASIRSIPISTTRPASRRWRGAAASPSPRPGPIPSGCSRSPISNRPPEAGSPPQRYSGAGYRPGGESGIAERGQGDTDTDQYQSTSRPKKVAGLAQESFPEAKYLIDATLRFELARELPVKISREFSATSAQHLGMGTAGTLGPVSAARKAAISDFLRKAI